MPSSAAVLGSHLEKTHLLLPSLAILFFIYSKRCKALPSKGTECHFQAWCWQQLFASNNRTTSKQEKNNWEASWPAELPSSTKQRENGLSNLLSVWSTGPDVPLQWDPSAGYKCHSIRNSHRDINAAKYKAETWRKSNPNSISSMYLHHILESVHLLVWSSDFAKQPVTHAYMTTGLWANCDRKFNEKEMLKEDWTQYTFLLASLGYESHLKKETCKR